MSYKLFLDDQRIAPDGWVQAWNYQDFREALNELGRPTTIAFDHDLGDQHDEFGNLLVPEPDGTAAALHVVMNPEILPLTFSVHTMNFSGGHRIKSLMAEAGSKLVLGPFNSGWEEKK